MYCLGLELAVEDFVQQSRTAFLEGLQGVVLEDGLEISVEHISRVPATACVFRVRSLHRLRGNFVGLRRDHPH
jgi:hypothetical protein